MLVFLISALFSVLVLVSFSMFFSFCLNSVFIFKKILVFLYIIYIFFKKHSLLHFQCLFLDSFSKWTNGGPEVFGHSRLTVSVSLSLRVGDSQFGNVPCEASEEARRGAGHHHQLWVMMSSSCVMSFVGSVWNELLWFLFSFLTFNRHVE